VPGWEVGIGSHADGVTVRTDEVEARERSHALLIDSNEAVDVHIGQELFLPVGSAWKARYGSKAKRHMGRTTTKVRDWKSKPLLAIRARS
jgi:hypothetical protein